MNHLQSAGGVPLGTRQVMIRESRLISLCHLEVRDGGLSEPGAIIHLRSIDIPRAEAWLMPMDVAGARRLLEQLTDALAGHE